MGLGLPPKGRGIERRVFVGGSVLSFVMWPALGRQVTLAARAALGFTLFRVALASNVVQCNFTADNQVNSVFRP